MSNPIHLGADDERLVAAALRASGVTVIVVDRDMTILAVHGEAAGRHGHRPEAIIGRRAPDVLPAATWHRVGPHYASALAGRTLTVDVPSSDGSAVYETRFAPVVEDGRVIGAVTTARDVTAHRIADGLMTDPAHDAPQRRAEALVSRMFDEAPAGMVLLCDGVIERANAAMGDILGVPPWALIGRLPVDFAHPAERAEVAAAAAAALPARSGETRDRRVVRADGATVHLRMCFSVLDDGGDGHRRVLVHCVDRTLEVEAERERERLFNLFETSFLDAPSGMAVLSPDGRLLRANPALCALLGRTEEQLAGSDGFDALVGGGPGCGEVIRDLVAGRGGRLEVDVRYPRLRGDVEGRLAVSVVRDAEGRATRVVAQLTDLTELGRTRRELSETMGRLQAILDNSPTAIYMRDLDHTWRVANPETCRIVGLPEERLIGRTMRQTHSPALFEHLARHDAEVLAGGVPVTFDEAAPDARTGRTHHWWSAKFPVRDAEGRVIGIGGMSLDVTERERALRELRAAEDLFAAAFESAPVAKLISRLLPGGGTEVVMCNAAFATMVGRSVAEIVGRTGAVVVHPDDLPERMRMVEELRAGRPALAELRYIHTDGTVVHTITATAPVRSADGAMLAVLQAVDISERTRMEEQLRHIAEHDALTGLVSRRSFEEALAREVARARRHGEHGCVLLLDLDGFKYVNDTFGHTAGDELLMRVASALRDALRETDVLARIGGDEFAAIVPHTDPEAGRAVAEKLVAAVREHGRVAEDADVAEVTASVGVTAIDGREARDPKDLLIEADVAMYQAKDAGRNTVAVYDPAGTGHARVVRRGQWIGRVRRALRDERFVLHAQPIVPLGPAGAAADADRYELLLRLEEDGNLITPGEFLHHAEHEGLVVEIDRWVVGRAVAMLHEAGRVGRDLTLAVNVSALSVQHAGVVGELRRLLAGRPIRPGSLVVEVTETAAITNLERAASLARELRDLGCRLAIDDFGTGFASLYYLKHLVFDVMKIDGDFIDRLPMSPTDQLVVRAVLDIARGLGVEVVAERVADQATVDLLVGLGVPYGQGYFLGVPAPLRGTLP